LVHELNGFVQVEWRRRRDDRLKQTKIAERRERPPNSAYDLLSFCINPRNTSGRRRERTLQTSNRLSIRFLREGVEPIGANNTLLAFASGEMSILYTPEMWRLSRGFVFDPCVLSM
jgi:hypothetical protein